MTNKSLDHAEMRRLYKAGCSRKYIASKMDCSISSVKKITNKKIYHNSDPIFINHIGQILLNNHRKYISMIYGARNSDHGD